MALTTAELRQRAEDYFVHAENVCKPGVIGMKPDIAVARTSIGMGWAYLWEIQARSEGVGEF